MSALDNLRGCRGRGSVPLTTGCSAMRDAHGAAAKLIGEEGVLAAFCSTALSPPMAEIDRGRDRPGRRT